jgi:hypothetical protein
MRSILLFFLIVSSCGTPKEIYNDPVNDVGSIEESLNFPDDKDFTTCNKEFLQNYKKIRQYYNFSKAIQYEGEKSALISHFRENYKIDSTSQESGYVTIRFVVNCKGQSGRFRIIELSNDYAPKPFSTQIRSQLYELTKSLKGWKIGISNDKSYDYYQYLTFKIKNGQITDILP